MPEPDRPGSRCVDGSPIAAPLIPDAATRRGLRRLNATCREDGRIDQELIGQSGRPPSPDLAARITRAYKLRQQPVEAPGAWTARGFFLWQSRRFSPATQILCEHVSRATLRVHATCRPSHFSSMRLLGFLSHSSNRLGAHS